MVNNISWADYLVVVALFLSVYYLVTVVFFYSRDLGSLWSRIRNGNTRDGPQEFASAPVADPCPSEFFNMEARSYTPQDPESQPSVDPLQEVEQLIAHLKEAIVDVKARKYSKEEFVLLLQLVLKEYPAFRGSPFQSAIRDFIISECEKQESISLTEADILDLLKENS